MESAEIEQRRREDVKSFNRKELKNSKKRRGSREDRWKKENR